jgi:hypothetical protein
MAAVLLERVFLLIECAEDVKKLAKEANDNLPASKQFSLKYVSRSEVSCGFFFVLCGGCLFAQPIRPCHCVWRATHGRHGATTQKMLMLHCFNLC